QCLGLTDAGGAPRDELQPATPALLTIDGGRDIRRDSNDIDDVVDGVTLHLMKAEPGTTVTMIITNDVPAATIALRDLVQAYDDWRSFVATQERSRGDVAVGAEAVLFADAMLCRASSAILKALSAQLHSRASAELGISIDEDGAFRTAANGHTTGAGNDNGGAGRHPDRSIAFVPPAPSNGVSNAELYKSLLLRRLAFLEAEISEVGETVRSLKSLICGDTNKGKGAKYGPGPIRDFGL
ncbi:MAG: flagellar filament capping protein FliD, partial [Alphaproteobacteria bacterium]|nr:flagellar filament capping protein FliD [Alphaproteobacteria bacterium]